MNPVETEVHYSAYLQLDRLLGAQIPLQPGAHDELLFIIVHQSYELWFKQIIHELTSIQRVFDAEAIEERTLGTVAARLQRISTIQQLLIDQIAVLETMTPLDFLDFRDALTPASGFQSVQFREIEIRLGEYGRADGTTALPDTILSRLKAEQRHYLSKLAAETSLFSLIDRWLARMPFLHYGHFDFWSSYRRIAKRMLAADTRTLKEHAHLGEAERRSQLKALEQDQQRFDALFDSDHYRELQARGEVRLGQDALLAALFIQLYRDEPILQLPFRILTHLVEIDERLSLWRYRHMIMVQRMLGSKIGTGGSAGHSYLKHALEQRRVFEDLFNLATYLIPRSQLPPLPEALRRDLDFHFSGIRAARPET